MTVNVRLFIIHIIIVHHRCSVQKGLLERSPRDEHHVLQPGIVAHETHVVGTCLTIPN